MSCNSLAFLLPTWKGRSLPIMLCKRLPICSENCRLCSANPISLIMLCKPISADYALQTDLCRLCSANRSLPNMLCKPISADYALQTNLCRFCFANRSTLMR
ncbi:hypothetical protein AVEN_115815-1 [Araneus ventricosus]|uniref:Uncharacterized protein n=1 Tax=Araneus ventricosus TaxID=182803 RepID=A0A4Y2WM13_ARAVE|nr:hypothetical protein AVEN_115815-1 [Araneus ventricosus]